MPVLLLRRPQIGQNQQTSAGRIRSSLLDGLLFSLNASNAVPEYSRFLTTTNLINKAYSVDGRAVGASGTGYKNIVDNTGIRFDTTVGLTSYGIEIAAASDWTCQIVVDNIAASAGNGGFWRNASGGTGTTFFIENGTTQRPWIRANGTNVLQAASGPQWPVGVGTTLNIMCRFVNAASVDVWWDGKQQHTATHAITGADMTGTLGIYSFGQQSAQQLPGIYQAIRFWNRALKDVEIAALSSGNGNYFYQPLQGNFWINPGAAPAVDVLMGQACL